MNRPLPGPLGNMTLEDFDGKRLRKSVMRKTVDYNSAIIKELEVTFYFLLIAFLQNLFSMCRIEFGKEIIETEEPSSQT